MVLAFSMILTDVLSMEFSLLFLFFLYIHFFIYIYIFFPSRKVWGNANSLASQNLFTNVFLFLVLVSYLYGLFYMNLHCLTENRIQVYHL